MLTAADGPSTFRRVDFQAAGYLGAAIVLVLVLRPRSVGGSTKWKDEDENDPAAEAGRLAK
jgi:hypothetical protein